MRWEFVARRTCVVALGVLLLGTLLAIVPVNVDSQKDRSVSGILYPRIGLPAFLEPSGDFAIRIAGQATDSWTASIFDEVAEYPLEILSAEFDATADETWLQVRISDVEPGLYDLVLGPPADDIDLTMVEPHSISVMASLEPPFRVVHITDTHYDTSEGQLHLKATLQRTIRLINFLRPDFVLHTGDACNNPFEEFFSGFRDELLALEVPIVVIPGNHDHAGEKNFFEKYIAPWDGSLDIGPVHVVYLDTGEFATAGGLRPDQVEWLREDLRRSVDSPVKIFMSHHPIFTNPAGAVKANSGLQNLTGADVDLLVSIFRDFSVDLILHGHQHESWVRHQPIPTLTTSNAYPGGHPYPGFRILTIHADHTISWLYNGREDAIPLFDLEVEYLQQYHPNRFIGGHPSGAVVSLVNDLEMPVDGVLTFRIQRSEDIQVSEGNVLSFLDAGDYSLLEIDLSLDPGEEKEVKVSTSPDTEPPEINEPDIDIVETKKVRLVKMNWTVVDLGSGIRDVTLSYSIDNETWLEEELLRVSVNHFGGIVQITPAETSLYYTLRAEDALGQEATFGPVALTFVDGESGDSEPAVIDSTLVLVGIVVAVAVALALLYRRSFRR